MKTNKLTITLFLFFSIASFLSSCKKDTLADPIKDSNKTVVDNKSSIEFTTLASFSSLTTVRLSSAFQITRDEKVLFTSENYDFGINDIINKTTNLELKSGDKITIVAFPKELKLCLFHGEIKINGSVVKSGEKACNNYFMYYTIP